MDYNKLYKEKLISAEDAAKLVKDGDYVDYSWGIISPPIIPDPITPIFIFTPLCVLKKFRLFVKLITYIYYNIVFLVFQEILTFF